MTASGSSPAGGGRGQRTSFLRLMGVVARRDYVRTVKRRGFIVGTLLLPLGFLALFGLSALLAPSVGTGSSTPGDTRIVIVNQSGLDLRGLAVAPAIALLPRDVAEDALAGGQIDEFYVVPPTWPARPDIQRIEPSSGGFSIDSAQRHVAQDELLAATLRAGLLVRSGVGEDVINRVVVPVQITTVTLDGSTVSDAAMAASFLLPLGFTLLFVMSIFITSGYLLQSVTEEKENRVVEILLSSVPSLPLMAGKILGLGASGLTQVAIWIGASLLFIPIIGGQVGGLGDLHVTPLVLVLGMVYFVLGYLCYGAIFTAVGAVAPGNREAQQYSGFFGFVAVIPLIFSSVFFNDIDSPIVWVLALFPLTAPASMLMVLTISPTLPVVLVLASLLSLSIFVVLATIASARVFRATLLLYGVRPSVRRILDAMLSRDQGAPNGGGVSEPKSG
jgi:ABC-2 type transport system permease protein